MKYTKPTTLLISIIAFTAIFFGLAKHAEAAISHVGTLNAGGTATSTYTFDLSGVSAATGDLLLVVLAVEQADYAYSFNLDNAGWSLIEDNQNGSATHRSKAWWNTIDGTTITTGSTITLTQGAPTTDDGLAFLTVIRGANTSNPFGTVTDREATATGDPLSSAKSGFTTSDWVLFGGSNLYGTTYTCPGSWNELGDHRSGTANSNVSAALCYATATTSIAADLVLNAANNDDWNSWTVVLSVMAVPTVTTQSASGVATSSATGNGNITATGGANSDYRGFVYDTASQSLPGNVATGSSGYAYTAEDAGDFGTGAYTKILTGLTPGQTYYARAYAHNSIGYSYGTEVSFIASPTLPVVTTQDASDITSDSATCNGNITNTGGENNDLRGCIYDTASHSLPGNVAPGSSGYASYAETAGSFSTGAFTQAVSGLNNGQTYYARAYSHNSSGYSYGSEISFFPPSPTTEAEFTVSAWVRQASSTASQAIIVKNNEIRLVTDSSAYPICQIHGELSWLGAATSSQALEFNKWHFVSCTYDGSNIKIYINGTETANRAETSEVSDTSNDWQVGSDEGGFYADWTGFIDEVKIYPYARTLDEVKQEYNAGLAGQSAPQGAAVTFGSASDKWLTDGLVGHWNFDESATTSGAADSSGNGNTGTFYSHASTTGGRFGNGGSFDGAGDFIGVNDSASLSVNSEITISSWFNPAETLSGTADYFQSLIDGGAYSLYFDKTDGKIKFTLDSDTTETWSEVGSGAGLSLYVYALTVYNGELYVGGSFTNPPFDTDADCIAKWDGANWSEVGTGAGLNNAVYALMVYNGELYVGGSFADPPFDTDADRIAKWDGANWSEVGTGAGLNSGVLAMAVYNNELYIGGGFSNPPFDTDADYIAKWDGANWSEVGSGAGLSPSPVYGLAVYNGELYVGGSFTNPPFDTDADYIAKWDGANWSEVGSGAGLNGVVYALGVYNGELYVSGNFTNPPFDTDADYIAKWDGVSWSETGIGAGIDSYIGAFGVYNGELYAASSGFTNPPFSAGTVIAKWDGVSWSEVGGVLNSRPYSFAVYNNELYIGGNFSNPSFDTDADRIAKFSSGNDLELDSTTTSWSGNTWYHITGTYDGTTARLYINGLEEASSPSSINIKNSSQDVYLGKSHGSRSYSYGSGMDEETVNGQLDEVRVYNRALSEKEVKKLYEWAPGPLAHWKMDEKSGATAFDSVASSSTAGGNDGTIYGATWGRGKYGSALDFDGSDDYVNIGNLGANIKTIGFWLKTDDTTSRKLINIDGTDQIEIDANGKIASTSFPNAIVYVDGIPAASIDTNWHYITVTDTSGVNASSFEIGRVSSSYFDGLIDDVRIYNYARTQKQILEDMSAQGGSASGGNGALKFPVLHLDFDKGYGTVADDSSGRAKNLTISSATRWRNAGKFGRTYYGGDNQRAYDDADDNDLDFGTSTDFTLSAWVRIATNPAATEYILDKHDDTGYEGYAFYMNTSGQVGFGIGDTSSASFPEDAALSTADLADNTWHHIVGRKTSNSKIELFVDRVLAATDSSLAANATLENSATLYIGDNNATDGTDEFLGYVDEVRIYNFALNEDEINTLYNGSVSAQLATDDSRLNIGTTTTGANKEYCVPGDTTQCDAPVINLDFNEKSGTTAYDTSAYGRNGTLNWMSTSTNGAWTRGKNGSGLQFDNIDDYVSLPAIGNLTDYSIELWYKPSERIYSGNTGKNSLYTLEDLTDTDLYLYHSALDDGELRYRCYLPTNDLLTTTADWAKDRWYHIAATYTNTGTRKRIYVNGILENSQTASCPFEANGDHWIGAGTYHTNAVLDGFKLYNYERTPAQVAWDYNRGAPVAHWSFNECEDSVIHDESGFGNHGALNLGASGTTATSTCASSSDSFWYNGRSGKYKSGGSFDGTDDYVNLSDNILDIYSIGTFCSWVNPDAFASDMSLLGYADTSGYLQKIFIGIFDSGRFAVLVRRNDSTNQMTIQTNNPVPAGAWSHVCATQDGSGIELYVNGAQADKIEALSGTATASDWFSTASSTCENASIGRLEDNTPGEYFDGLIDEVKIYNYGLTPEQVRQEYNGGAIRFGE